MSAISVQVVEPHVTMVDRWVMLGEIVGFVGGSWSPVNNEVSLFNSVADPIEKRVDGF